MSAIFPRALLEEALGKSPRLIRAFETLGDAMEAFEAKLSELEARAAVVGVEYQPRSAILDALSALPADEGVVEQTLPGVFEVRPVDSTDSASLLSKAKADTLY